MKGVYEACSDRTTHQQWLNHIFSLLFHNEFSKVMRINYRSSKAANLSFREPLGMTTHHSVIIKDNFHAIYIVIKRVLRSLMFSPSLLHITVRYSVLLKLSLWARVVIPWHSLVHRITTTLGSQRMLLWFTTNKYYKTCSDASHGAFCLLFCTKNYQPVSSIAIDYNVMKWEMGIIYLDLLGAFYTSIRSIVGLFYFHTTSIVSLFGFSLIQRSIDYWHMFRG